jgi:hypothetical protein
VLDGDTVYTVIVWHDQSVTCNCRKGRKANAASPCKHIEAAKLLPQNYRLPGIPVPVDLDDIGRSLRLRVRGGLAAEPPAPPRLRAVAANPFDD